ncbi:diacylglycerol/polyprenol kinase family protein [Persephonella sp.]
MDLRKEIIRKLFHIVSILLLLFPLYLFGKYSITLISALMLLVLLPVSYFRSRNFLTEIYWKIIDTVERDKNLRILPGRQAFSLSVGLLIVSLFLDERSVAVSIICVAVYDGFATIAGLLFGKTKILGRKKSLEGMVGGFIPNIIVLMFLVTPLISVILTLTTAIIEFFSSDKRWFTDDNLTIPVFVGFLYYFLSNFPSEGSQFFSSFL